ncbi:MAG TPA: winged helix-turn-helix domain-containing protein [Tepidisphaeraceae bacterium]|jgi:hypothetical protein|nr:winged helix-turn-helix domain-containing protein [Tepidisphaeraceae bacterium]
MARKLVLALDDLARAATADDQISIINASSAVVRADNKLRGAMTDRALGPDRTFAFNDELESSLVSWLEADGSTSDWFRERCGSIIDDADPDVEAAFMATARSVNVEPLQYVNNSYESAHDAAWIISGAIWLGWKIELRNHSRDKSAYLAAAAAKFSLSDDDRDAFEEHFQAIRNALVRELKAFEKRIDGDLEAARPVAAAEPLPKEQNPPAAVAVQPPVAPAIDKEDLLILQAVASSPSALTVVDLATRVRRSPKTCGVRVRRLIDLGYLRRLTDRGGVYLTDKGRGVLGDSHNG